MKKERTFPVIFNSWPLGKIVMFKNSWFHSLFYQLSQNFRWVSSLGRHVLDKMLQTLFVRGWTDHSIYWGYLAKGGNRRSFRLLAYCSKKNQNITDSVVSINWKSFLQQSNFFGRAEKLNKFLSYVKPTRLFLQVSPVFVSFWPNLPQPHFYKQFFIRKFGTCCDFSNDFYLAK